MNKKIVSKTLQSREINLHLKWGFLSGLYIGGLLAWIESIYLLLQLGTFFMSFSLFLTFFLLYSFIGASLGIDASLLLFFLRIRKEKWTNEETSSFYFSLFLGLALFAEIFFYLTDIYPFGGVNKWSLKTLSLIGMGALFSYLLAWITYSYLNKLLRKSFFKPKGIKLTVLIVIPLILLISFISIQRIKTQEERKSLKVKKIMLKKKMPNVLLIVVDSLRSDHLSCNGYHLPTSPYLDRMASEGALFKATIATSTWSVPTHASLFTGLYPSSHGAFSLYSVLPENIPTLAEILYKKGYSSLMLYNNPLLGKAANLNRGFDLALGVEHHNKTSFTLERLYKRFITKSSPSEAIITLASRWANYCLKNDIPYFVFMNLFDVHYPSIPKKPYFQDFVKSIEVNKVNHSLVRAFSKRMKSRKRKLELFSRLSSVDMEYLIRAYDSNIRYVDKLVEDLMRKLKNKEKSKNTLFILTADHGEYLGEIDFMGHLIDKLYNPVLKIPLIFHFPEKLNPFIEKNYVSQVDIMPTILSLVGLEEQIPQEVQGKNLFSGKNSEPLIIEFWDDIKNKFSRAIISSNMKLILKGEKEKELYDLIKDPEEKINLYSTQSLLSDELEKLLELKIKSFKKYEPKMDEKKKRELKKVLQSLSYIN